jgi:hypothetical protein
MEADPRFKNGCGNTPPTALGFIAHRRRQKRSSGQSPSARRIQAMPLRRGNLILQSKVMGAQNDVTKALEAGALEYFDVGMDLYQKHLRLRGGGFQAILGNFAISIELKLKSIVAQKLFPYLYTDLSKAAQAILSHPKVMPEGTSPSSFIGDLRDFTKRSIDLDQAISYFYLLHPEHKQELRPHLALLARTRNTAVHGATPAFHKYHLERVVYLACKILILTQEEKFLAGRIHPRFEFCEAVIKKYDAARVAKVHSAIEGAKKGARALGNTLILSIGADEWNVHLENCPVCGNEGFVYGYTEEDQDDIDSALWFHRDQFECTGCGLKLEDSIELELAGIEATEDFTDQLEAWRAHAKHE